MNASSSLGSFVSLCVIRWGDICDATGFISAVVGSETSPAADVQSGEESGSSTIRSVSRVPKMRLQNRLLAKRKWLENIDETFDGAIG